MGSYANLADYQPWALAIGVQISGSPLLINPNKISVIDNDRVVRISKLGLKAKLKAKKVIEVIVKETIKNAFLDLIFR